MAINSLQGFGGFNSYKVVDIPKVDIEAVKKQEEEKKASEAVIPQSQAVAEAKSEPQKPDNRTRSANLEDVSLTFNKGDDFSFLGSEFKLEDLDMQKAISDMRKDSILQDYQFFVGTSEGIDNSGANPDGKVFLKLN